MTRRLVDPDPPPDDELDPTDKPWPDPPIEKPAPDDDPFEPRKPDRE